MAPSQEQIQTLIQARHDAYAEAFASLSAETVASWQSKDLIYHDPMIDSYHMTHTDSLNSFTEQFATMSSLKILEQSSSNNSSNSPNFTTWEMLMEAIWNVDVPSMGMSKGKKVMIRGVVLLWWRWEGEGDGSWDGDVSEAGVRGWKIVREHDYMVVLKEGAEGVDARMFGE